MSRNWSLSSYVDPGLRLARRNAGKIVLFTVASTGVIAAATYFRKQFTAVNESLEEERKQGARKMRMVFISNTQTVCVTLRSLLPVARKIMDDCSQIDSDVHVQKLREKPQSKIEKQELWEQVKVASITHLFSTAYIVGLLYSFLSLQINLLSRYTSRNLDAPVQSLPSGMLTSATSKRFMDLARRNILQKSRIEEIIEQIKEPVTERIRTVNLTEKMGINELKNLFEDILDSVRDKLILGLDSEISVDADTQTPLSFLHPMWALSEDERSTDGRGNHDEDINYHWLLRESLDLCDVLEFSDVVQNCASVIILYSIRCLHDDLWSSEARGKLAFAHLLAHISNQATRIFTKPHEDDDVDGDHSTAERSALEQVMYEDDNNAHFAASVFLSGEKEKDPMPEPMHGSTVTETSAQGTEFPVTNISDLRGPEESGDLGLMFDIENVDE